MSVHVKPLKMQPTFRVELLDGADEVAGKLRQAISTSELRDHAVTAGRCIDFQIDNSDQRFWSPHLSVQISDTDSGSEIFGRFAPRPEIWTMFMAIYAVVLIVMFGAAIYGYVQWYMNAKPWVLIALPIGSIVIIAIHAASLFGQRLSSDQMQTLRNHLDRAIELAFTNSSAQ